MNSYLFLEHMVCHLTISDDTGFAFFNFNFPVYVKSIISTSKIREYVRNVECYNDTGWT